MLGGVRFLYTGIPQLERSISLFWNKLKFSSVVGVEGLLGMSKISLITAIGCLGVVIL